MICLWLGLKAILLVEMCRLINHQVGLWREGSLSVYTPRSSKTIYQFFKTSTLVSLKPGEKKMMYLWLGQKAILLVKMFRLMNTPGRFMKGGRSFSSSVYTPGPVKHFLPILQIQQNTMSLRPGERGIEDNVPLIGSDSEGYLTMKMCRLMGH